MAVPVANDKPVLVLLHGWGLNHAVWQQLLPQLTGQFSVLTPDLPGFGLAVDYPEPYRLADVAAVVAEQIPHGSLVLGWSLGGLVATQIALDYPEKVRALALVASSPCFVAAEDWPGMAPLVLRQFAAALAKDVALTIDRFLAIQALGSATARQEIKLLKQALLTLPLPQSAALAGGLTVLAEVDLRPRLSELSMPVTGCFGRLDSLVPVAMLDKLQLLLPNAALTMLPKASHAPFISHPEEFSQWLLQWAQIMRKKE
ncbi:pimeloyl-[acyl-carrier protein] methyl ester esterase [Rheinheimera riviphila]|uniref:Pimeloyl-[acyl-carrier protein] methyl ester esterase n=1 Tax=Rheinheimera riviphila TaxID=1834037 RepID=A0A437QZL0_9GAMM|nr:pimeloyl-ACP methyl ester esterase BioH [Rheinheimera riviphila]RVU39901.1 pimeloyl-[acyl-carrier protein] methyl ester esterase [Rheinheimera riviphila]